MKRGLKILTGSDLQRLNLHPQCLGGALHLAIFRVHVVWVPDNADAVQARGNVAQELQPFGRKIGGNKGDARDVASGVSKTRYKATGGCLKRGAKLVF